MPGTLEVQVPFVDELAPAVARCAVVEDDQLGGVPLLLDQTLHQQPQPGVPGVYVWSTPQDQVDYIGVAKDLDYRLGRESGWVRGYDPDGDRWEVSVVHMLKVHGARPGWVRASSWEAAQEVERRLIEWHRALVGMAPIAVGWDVKASSIRGRAQSWAQHLWREAFPAGIPAAAGRAAGPGDVDAAGDGR